jgi:sensor histidine kinase YesM
MKLRLLGLLGWLAFCFLFSASIKLWMAGSLERFFFHWDSPFWMFLDCLIGAVVMTLIRNNFGLLSINKSSASRDFLILVALIPFIALLTTFFAIIIIEEFVYGKSHTLYNWTSEYLVNIILQSIAGLSCISYFYFSTLNEIRGRLSAAQLAQTEMQLKILQQKVDPHFLFNNLNVLSSLIEKNPRAANEFLDKLAQLYRYILHTQNADVVSIEEELSFAENYLYLLQQRFGTAYNFDWQILKSEISGQMIVPTALQSLLENVVKHNAGSREKPLPVCVKFDRESLIVENELRPKSLTAAPSGTGLQNLQARYVLLTENPVEVLKNENAFAVKIPLLCLKK